MASRSLNKVILIGNLTRDPELRYTPAGTAVCSFGLATNRSWATQTGETKEETEFHRIVAWNKLGELCAQLLAKGRKVYVEGRLSTHTWTAQDGSQKTSTEIVIEEMIILDSKRVSKEEVPFQSAPAGTVKESTGEESSSAAPTAGSAPASQTAPQDTGLSSSKKQTKKTANEKEETDQSKGEKQATGTEDITPDDIPF